MCSVVLDSSQGTQSKGWPFLCLCWASLSFGLLHGNYRFSNHWLYFQDWFGIFNEKNPGYVVYFT